MTLNTRTSYTTDHAHVCKDSLSCNSLTVLRFVIKLNRVSFISLSAGTEKNNVLEFLINQSSKCFKGHLRGVVVGGRAEIQKKIMEK